MRLPQNHVMKIASSLLVILMMLHSCESSRYSQLTIVDNNIKRFLNEEQRKWSDINASINKQAKNATLTKLFENFGGYVNQAEMGRVDVVRAINPELAEKIDQIKRTQHQSTRWLIEKNYQDEKSHCENILHSIPNALSQVFDLTKKPEFLTYLRDNSDFCQTSKRFVTAGVEDLNLQNVVMDFYITIAETLTKGYMASQMAYMILEANSQPKKYQSKSIELHQSFESQYKTLATNVRSIVSNFSGEIWNCDNFSSNYTYAEITNFIQGYIDNEVNFNQDDTCKNQCSDYEQVEYHTCRNNTLCILNYLDKNKTRCDGKIRSCQYIESDMTVCPNEDDQIMTRRYNYIRYDSGLLLGQHHQHCQYPVRAKSWLRWFVSCSYCFCYCDHENQFSDRFFSLRESLSKIDQNKVVTGIQLFKKNRIIHLFVSERTIGKYGKIEETSASNEAEFTGDYNFLVEEVPSDHYHRLTWDSRGIDLDTIRAPKDEVVTGVRFRVENNRIRLEIRTTAYNKENGNLSRDTSRTVWRANNYHNKEKIPNDGHDVSTRTPEQSRRDRRQNQFIEFTPTDMYKDVSQTTVPFIDTQPVEAKIPKPLRGAGLYWKSTPGFGGFIGPLIILHDD